MGVTPRANQLRFQTGIPDRLRRRSAPMPRFAGITSISSGISVFTRKPRNPSPQNRRRELCFKLTGARYLTSWDVAAHKPSAASEMDNQADTILDSGDSTANEPNCAAQLAGRNYVRM